MVTLELERDGVAAFLVILAILNGPSLVKAITYPFTHSEESDNQQLTQQYRDIYGYEKHPEFLETIQPTATPAPVVSGEVTAQNVISIPKIGVSAPIIQTNDSSDTAILAALKNGVVLYPGSSNPGQPGSAVIIGHSSSDLPWTKYSAVFSLLGKLQPDDLIYVKFNGVEHTYRIRTIQKGSAQQLVDAGLAGDLVVSTCWPIGTDTNRIAVSASLVQ